MIFQGPKFSQEFQNQKMTPGLYREKRNRIISLVRQRQGKVFKGGINTELDKIKNVVLTQEDRSMMETLNQKGKKIAERRSEQFGGVLPEKYEDLSENINLSFPPIYEGRSDFHALMVPEDATVDDPHLSTFAFHESQLAFFAADSKYRPYREYAKKILFADRTTWFELGSYLGEVEKGKMGEEEPRKWAVRLLEETKAIKDSRGDTPKKYLEKIKQIFLTEEKGISFFEDTIHREADDRLSGFGHSAIGAGRIDLAYEAHKLLAGLSSKMINQKKGTQVYKELTPEQASSPTELARYKSSRDLEFELGFLVYIRDKWQEIKKLASRRDDESNAKFRERSDEELAGIIKHDIETYEMALLDKQAQERYKIKDH